MAGTEERWDSQTAESYDSYSLTDHECVWQAIAEHLLPFSKDRSVVDLGAGAGLLGQRLQARQMVNVDPYPPLNPKQEIVKCDGVEYLTGLEESSLDLVCAVFAVHLMDRASLDREVCRVLRPGGLAMWISVGVTTPFFHNEEFNRIFVSVGFERNGGGEAGDKPTKTLSIERPATHDLLHNFITHKSWSNLKIMPDSDVARLADLVPKDLTAITLHIDVYEFERMECGKLVRR